MQVAWACERPTHRGDELVERVVGPDLPAREVNQPVEVSGTPASGVTQRRTRVGVAAGRLALAGVNVTR